MILNHSLRHSEWRKLAKKQRRKRIRQTLAEARKQNEEQENNLSPTSLKRFEEEEEFQREEEARLRKLAEERWLKVEEEAQKQWRELQKRLEDAREERARQNALIKIEWEREQKRLQQIKEAKEREREELERKQRLLQEEVENFIENGGKTPEHLKTTIEMNPAKQICPFFQKTSACRFGDTCSRNHIKPGVSRILLISNFYSHYSLEQNETEHGDSSLEFENDETYMHFREFFFDVLCEMEKCGRIRQLKVCCNHEPHLRGNVYVEYSATREAVKSFRVFNGRWYGGRQLNVEFCTIDSWKSAICGLHFKKRCPKGSTCNYLHVFHNPKNLFGKADRDMHRTPPPRSRSSSKQRSSSERRNWRWSESPERLSLDVLSKRSNGGSSEKTIKRSSHTSKRRKRSRSRSRERSNSRRHKSKRR